MTSLRSSCVSAKCKSIIYAHRFALFVLKDSKVSFVGFRAANDTIGASKLQESVSLRVNDTVPMSVQGGA